MFNTTIKPTIQDPFTDWDPVLPYTLKNLDIVGLVKHIARRVHTEPTEYEVDLTVDQIKMISLKDALMVIEAYLCIPDATCEQLSIHLFNDSCNRFGLPLDADDTTARINWADTLATDFLEYLKNSTVSS